MKKPELAVLGLILVFSCPLIFNIGLINMTSHKYQFYFYSVIAVMILELVGFVLEIVGKVPEKCLN